MTPPRWISTILPSRRFRADRVMRQRYPSSIQESRAVYIFQLAQGGRNSRLLFIPQIPKEFYGPRAVAGIVVVRISKSLEVFGNELAEQFDPVCQILAAVDDEFVPGFRLLLDPFAIPEPPHIGEVCCDQVELIFELPRARNPALVD